MVLTAVLLLLPYPWQLKSLHASFLFGKICVAQKQKKSIPRLDLKAAETSMLLVTAIAGELEIAVDSVIYCTEATCVLHYLGNLRAQGDQTYL